MGVEEVSDAHDVICHYPNIAGLMGNLERQTLSATRFAYLNGSKVLYQ